MGRSGVPVVQALSIVAEVVGNKYIGSKIIEMGVGSAEESLFLTAQRSNIFLPLVLQMIAVGEESGNLPDLLDEVSDFYDGEIEYDLNRLTESIEPILIIFIAALVLVLARIPADLGFRRYLAGISSEFLCPGRCSVLSGINISRKAARK